MLKPKFANMAAMISEFKEALEYMDKDMPKDTTLIKKSKTAPVSRQVVTESIEAPVAPVQAEAAPLSKYSTPSKAMQSFRVLAGLEVREMSPWNPGILGETRTVKKLQEDFGMSVTSKVKK